MDFGGYCDPEAGVCIFKRFPGPGALFTTSINIFIFRNILNRNFPTSFSRKCSKIMAKSSAETIFHHNRESYWNAIKTLSDTIWKIMAIVMTKRKILVDEFATHNFSQNIFVYTCRKQCPCPGKSSENAYNGFRVAITSKIHDFLLKNQGKSLIFHGFLCQNFPTVNPQQPPCLPQGSSPPLGAS